MKKGSRKQSSLEKEQKFLAGELIECEIHGLHSRWYTQTYKPTGALYLTCSFCQNKKNAEWKLSNTFKVLACNAKSNSDRKLRRGRAEFSVFELDEDYIRSLYMKQNGKCALSGVVFDHRSDGAYGISVDRIDSSKGYLRSNTQLVLNEINSMKREFSDSKFIGLCKLVADHNRQGAE